MIHVLPAYAQVEDCAGALGEMFDQMRVERYRSDDHPNSIPEKDFADLKPNTRVYLDARDLARIAPIQEGQKVAPMYVLGYHEHKLHLFSVPLGWIVIAPGSSVRMYRRAHFARRSPFLKGEFVQLGLGLHTRLKMWRMSDQSEHDINQNSLPWVAKFVRALNADAYEIEFPRVADGVSRRYEVRRSYVNRLRTGRAQTLRSILARLDHPGSFSLGEKVRFRDRDGLMQTGVILDRAGDTTHIERENRLEKIPRADIFKSWTNGHPHSISFDTTQLTNEMPHSIPLEAPRGFLREVLNAAAQLAAHPEFHAAPFRTKLELLMEFQNVVLPYTSAGDTLEATGIQTYSQILCAGTGLCRHNSPLMAAIFSEAGLATWIVHRIQAPSELIGTDDTHLAHAWTEVAAPNGEIYVVDPSNKVVKTISESRQSQDAKDVDWWAHAARERLAPKILN